MKTILTFAILTLTLCCASVAQAGTLRTVVLSGTVAPGTSETYSSVNPLFLDTPVLNSAGHVVFVGALNGSTTTNSGIWSEGVGGSLALVARKGSPAPGTIVNYADFDAPLLNGAGQTAFLGTLISSLPTNRGIWSQGGAVGLTLVARNGEMAPGVGANFVSFNDIAFNIGGQTAFAAFINSSAETSRGIWSGGGGGLALVARTGDTAPGTTDNYVGFLDPLINSAGQTAFRANLDSSLPTNHGIWSEGGGSGLALVARTGDTAPGTTDTYKSLGALVLNSAGQTAFRGPLNSLPTTSDAIWSEGGGSGLALVARAGIRAPGTIAPYTSFGGLVLNSAGQTAFNANLSSTSTTNSGIWSEGGGSGLALVAREGNTAPGTTDKFTGFNPTVLNSAGQTAFRGFLNSGSATNLGIWAQDSLGILTLIVREGDLLDVDDGPGIDLRTINNLFFVGGPGSENGRASGFNDLGQLAFWASFTDGSSGIFVSNLVATIATIAGDLNGDGFVGIADLNIVLGNWNLNVPPGDPLADPSGDGFVGIADLNVVLGNWNAGTPPTTEVLGNVPEPGSMVVLGAGAVVLLRRRA